VNALRLLNVGDPHCRVEDLNECDRLMEQVHDTAEKVNPDAVVFMGDLFHTHSLMHVEVASFWVRWMETLDRWARRVILGNHDGPHDPKPGVHALRVFSGIPGVTIVDAPQEWQSILWLPYFRDPRAFIDACKRSQLKTVYCHQEFDGAEYEGGYYAKDGVPPTTIPQEQVVSGHIHSEQEFGKVWYVGAPRWLTIADANRDRHIWLVEHDAGGKIVSRTPFSTAGACSPIVRLTEEPGSVGDPAAVAAGARVFVDIRGPSEWVAARAAAWGDRARVRCTVTDRPAPKVRESDGIGVAARKYMASYEPRHGTEAEALRALAEVRLGEVFRVGA
jgi:hypothetical protein